MEISESDGRVFLIPLRGTAGANSNKTALNAPILYENHMAPSSVAVLLTQKKSTSEWVQYFTIDAAWKDDDDSSYQDSVQSDSSPELTFDESVVEGGSGSEDGDEVPPFSEESSNDSFEREDEWSDGGGSEAAVTNTLKLIKKVEADVKALDVPELRAEFTSKITNLRDDLGALIDLPRHPDGERFTSIVDSLEYVLITLVDHKVQRSDDVAWVNRSLADVNTAITKACVETSNALKTYVAKELRRTSPSIPPRSTAATVNVDTPLYGLSTTDPQSLRDMFSYIKRLESESSARQANYESEIAALKVRLGTTEADLKASVQETKDLRLAVKSQVSSTGSLDHPFSSKRDIITALRTHGLEHFVAIDVFTDACNFLIHGQSEDTTTSEMLASFKNLEKSNYSYKAFCFLHGMKQRMVRAYTGKATQYDSDKPISALSSKDNWCGKNATGGTRKVIKKLIANANETAKKHITNCLPSGDLRDLANDMLAASKEFHEDIIAYFDDEFTLLTQKEFKPKDVLQFLSDQFGTMFEAFYDIRSVAYSTTETVDTLERLADFLWLTIQCHDKMAEFRKDGFQNHHLMQSALNRFSALHSGLKPSDVASKSDLDSLKKQLQKETKQAMDRAEVAVTRADKAVDTLGKKK